MLIKMAWRNLWRNKRRTFITTASVAFGLWMAVTFVSMQNHAYSQAVDNGVRIGSGHLTVQPPGYLEAPGLDKVIPLAETTAESLRAVPGVESASVRIEGQAMFAVAGRTVGGMFLALDPARETGRTNLMAGLIQEGALFKPGDKQGVVVGEGLARKLKLGLGKKLVYTTTDKHGEVVSEAVRVRGILKTGVPEVDGYMALLPLENARRVLGYGPQEATRVAILVDRADDTEAIQAQLAGRLDRSRGELLSWRTSMSDLAAWIAVDRVGGLIFVGFVALLIAAGILNTVLMSVLERTREFGVMLAIGLKPKELFVMVLAESIFVALVGLVIGALITSPWAVYMIREGLDLTSMYGSDTVTVGSAFIDPILRFEVRGGDLLRIALALLAITLLSGLYPAWKAGRVPPLESIRVV